MTPNEHSFDALYWRTEWNSRVLSDLEKSTKVALDQGMKEIVEQVRSVIRTEVAEVKRDSAENRTRLAVVEANFAMATKVAGGFLFLAALAVLRYIVTGH